MDKKTIKVLVDYVAAQKELDDATEAYTTIKNMTHTLQMVQAEEKVNQLRDQLVDLMDENESILEAIDEMRALCEGLLGDYIQKFS